MNAYNRVTCIGYNTGKLVIGSCHMPKPRKMNQDEHEIQDILLSKPFRKAPVDVVGEFLALSLYSGIAKLRKIALRLLK